MHNTMKKRIFPVILFSAAALTPLLFATGCAPYDYSDRLSEVRSDLFLAETEEFTLTLACTEREYPYADDGIPCPMTKTVQITLTPAAEPADEVEIYVGEGDARWGGDASFRTTHGDYTLSQGVDAFPEGSVTVSVTYGETEHSLAATSVRTEETISLSEALAYGVAAEQETLGRMESGGVFCGELCVRLLHRDKNYYYFAVTDGEERVSLLLDGETGEVLARREDTLRS